jgi:transcriptional regulator with XRE-family HTH domain
MGLSQNIATLRKNVGMSQEKLAEKCGVSRQSVTKWESGESEPSIDKLCRLSDVFNVSLDDLIKYNASPKTNDFDAENVTMYIYALIQNPMWQSDSSYGYRLSLLSALYKMVKEKFYTDAGALQKKYLISNTDKEEREEFVALIKPGYSATPFDGYIQGKCEVDEAIDTFIEELADRELYERERTESVRKSEVKKNYIGVLALALDYTTGAFDFEDCTQKAIDKNLKMIDESLNIEEKSLANKLILFFKNQICEAVKNRNQDAIDEISIDLQALENYFYYKAESQKA